MNGVIVTGGATSPATPNDGGYTYAPIPTGRIVRTSTANVSRRAEPSEIAALRDRIRGGSR